MCYGKGDGLCYRNVNMVLLAHYFFLNLVNREVQLTLNQGSHLK